MRRCWFSTGTACQLALAVFKILIKFYDIDVTVRANQFTSFNDSDAKGFSWRVFPQNYVTVVIGGLL